MGQSGFSAASNTEAVLHEPVANALQVEQAGLQATNPAGPGPTDTSILDIDFPGSEIQGGISDVAQIEPSFMDKARGFQSKMQPYMEQAQDYKKVYDQGKRLLTPKPMSLSPVGRAPVSQYQAPQQREKEKFGYLSPLYGRRR